MPHTDSQADDIVRVNQSTLISLNRDARQLPLHSAQIQSQFSGQYLSSFKGRGMEFDESRPYQAGDDIRSMDWKVTARTGTAHSKVFREERERPVLLWVDYRQTMFFATQQHFKSVLASKIAALLAWSTAQHGDRLGGLIFSDNQNAKENHIELRPSRGKSASLHFIKQLAQHPAMLNSPNQQEKVVALDQSENSAAESLGRLQRVSKPGSLVFLISDFRHMNEQAWSRLSLLSHHSDVVLISIHDPLEQHLPPAGIYKITDGEKSASINTYNKKISNEYQKRYLNQQQSVIDRCRKQHMHFFSISTTDDILQRLQMGLGINRIKARSSK